MNNKKRALGALTSTLIIFSLIGCSESSHVKEEVNVKPDQAVTTTGGVAADKDVNVNVKVGNNAPAPTVVHDTTTHIINNTETPSKQLQDKQIVINNNISTPENGGTGTELKQKIETDVASGSTSTTTTTDTSN